MTRATRFAIIVGAVVVAAAAFVLLRPDDEEPASQQTTAQVPTEAEAETAPAADPQAPEPKPRPQITTIRFRAGKPVGGVTKITARKGDTVRFVASSDVADEVHLHGYDISRDVAPGKDARFRFAAKIEGIFGVELEEQGVPIASLEVRP